MEIKAAAKEYLIAAARFDRAWDEYCSTIEPLSDERFFALLPLFRAEIEKFQFRYARTDGVEVAGREFYRKTVTGENEGQYTFEEALHFAKAYDRMYSRLDQALHEIVDECSDDGYSDLCDSLPLADEETVKRSLRSHPMSDRPRRDGFLNNDEFDEALRGLGDEWYRFIRRGENYVRDGLRRAARYYWLHLVRTGGDGTDWDDEAQRVLSGCQTPE